MLLWRGADAQHCCSAGSPLLLHGLKQKFVPPRQPTPALLPNPPLNRRKKKNNPILLGEPGVGKTAIAEGLARAIVSRTNADGSPLPAFLWNKRVMQLDVGLLIAGAKVNGSGGV